MNTIASMTGFAESAGSHEGLRWRWETKSVNSRSLDLRLRTPPGYDGLEAPARTLLETQREAMRGNDDNAAFTRDVGHPLARAIKAFGEARYDEAVRLIRPIRSIAHRFGGSHAQRDVIDLALIEAALRAGDATLARALTAERQLARPDSPLSALLSRRASDLSEN